MLDWLTASMSCMYLCECCVCLLYSLTRQWQDEKVTYSKELSEATAKQQVIICLLIVLILTNVLCLLLSLR